MIYTHVAAVLIGAAVASAGAWQVQGWRYGGQIAAMKSEQAEAMAKAQADADALRESHRLALRKADATAQKRIAAISTGSATIKREIAHAATPDLDCRLDPASVRMLNTWASLPDAPQD